MAFSVARTAAGAGPHVAAHCQTKRNVRNASSLPARRRGAAAWVDSRRRARTLTARPGVAISSTRFRMSAGVAAPATGSDGKPPMSKTEARLWLAMVPICWGTYNPTLRLLYTQDHAPGPAEFSATRMVFSVLPFVPRLKELILAALRDGPAEEAPPAPAAAADGQEERRDGGSSASTAPTASASAAAAAGAPVAALAAASAGPSARDVLLWSAELGSWNFLGTGLQAWGLAHTSAVHASLLFASINVFVPVIASITGEKVSPVTWVAASLVVYGVGVLNGIDVANMAASDSGALAALAGIEQGDVAVLLASAAYSTYTVRLSRSASRASAFDLAAGKTLTLVFWSFLWAAAEIFGEWDRPLGTGSALWGGEGTSLETQLIVWGAVVFTAIVPGSLATWLQAKGQSAVSGPEAQLILAVTPVVAVTLAAVFLGEEIAQNAWRALDEEGGGVVLGASTLANAVGYFEANKAERKKEEEEAAAKAAAAAASAPAAADGLASQAEAEEKERSSSVGR